MPSDSDRQAKADAKSVRPQLPADTLCYAFEQLANGAVEVEITFQGQVYRLRKTKNGRLILTK